jgi:DNA-binding transcriptional LysR family regulator
MDTIDNIDLRSLRLFEAVARHQSFAEAGREFGMPRALASKLIADLEQSLGGKLFRRTTRKVGLTELGESLLAKGSGPTAQLRQVLQEARTGVSEVAGLVRFSVSHAYGRRFILPIVAAFRSRYPRVQVEVILGDSIDDLILKTLDFSIRLGPLPDTSMVARRLPSLEVVLAATADLLKQQLPLMRIEDLSTLPMIGFRVPGSGTLLPWVFTKDGQRSVIDASHVGIASNSIEAVADLIMAGVGVAPVPRYLIDSVLAAGTVRQLFPDYRFSDIPVHLCFTDRELMPARVRLLIDAIVNGIS